MGGGGSLTPFFFCANLLVRVKLGYPHNFNFLGKPLLGEKYVEGKKKKKERIMPSLVATTSTPARKPFVRTHSARTNCSANKFIRFPSIKGGDWWGGGLSLMEIHINMTFLIVEPFPKF